MSSNYKQLDCKHIETRKVSYLIKSTDLLFVLIFTFITLAKLVNEFDYNHIKSRPTITCIVGEHFYFQPLEFRELTKKHLDKVFK